MRRVFLTAEWRKLAIANYEVDPKILLPYLPFGTELDIWNGKNYISLVGFRFINTRLAGIAIPFHRHFEEVNLRFYVRFKSASGWRRGVTFIREIVPLRALTFVANYWYKEKYITMPMKHHWDLQPEQMNISYSWKFEGSWNSFSLTADPNPLDLGAGTEEEFITEHYWGYTPVNERTCSEYGVEHPRWQHYAVKEYSVEVDFGKIYGPGFGFLTGADPDSVMLAEGSEIVVRSKRTVK